MESFPHTRLRRNRFSQHRRNLVAENTISTNDLVYPVFILDGINRKEEITTMPNQFRVSIDHLLDLVGRCQDVGINAIAIFPIIETDKNVNRLTVIESYEDNGLVPRAVRAIKSNFPNMLVFTDIALDGYTFNGHDGVCDDNGYVLNDETVEILAKQALCHARSGCDYVCPSDMMDGRVKAIRQILDINGFINTGILAYSAKYASSFYGPFRDATCSVSGYLGSDGKRGYQMDSANTNEALREVSLDLAEGADIIMIKPGLPYLDVLSEVKREFICPVASYHVSGEYTMLYMSGQNGYIDYNNALLESMLCFKRAGADIVWTYAALDVACLLK